MSELDKLIEVTNNLCNTLDTMAENERKYGYEMAQTLEFLSYDAFKIGETLKVVKDYVRGG